MDKLQELLAKRAAEVEKLSKLYETMNADGYEDNDTDKAAETATKAAIEALDARIKRAKDLQALRGASAQPVGERGVTSPIYRAGGLKHFKGEGAAERAYRFGQFMLAALGFEKAAAWCQENGIILAKAHSEGSNTAGGLFVPEEFSMSIIDLRDTYGMFRRLCTPYPMGRDTMTVPRRVSGLTAYPVGEGNPITASQAGWDQVRLTAKKWGVLTLMSSELDEDAVINIGDLLVSEIAYAFAQAEDAAGFSGDGTSAYHGTRGLLKIFTDGLAAGSTPLAGSVDAASGHDTFAELDSTDLATLMAKLPLYVYQRGRPAWYCSQVAWATVFQRLIMGSGGISKSDATGKVEFSYLGFPVELSPSMPVSTGDLSDLPMILFGDIGMAAAFGDRRGMTVARSTEYKFAEDQIAIKATERFDIHVHAFGTATVPGPVIALMGE